MLLCVYSYINRIPIKQWKDALCVGMDKGKLDIRFKERINQFYEI